MTLLERDREKIEQGRNEGLKKGLKEGRSVGLKEGKIDVAKNLISMKLSVEQIILATGLSREDIEKIQEDK